MTGATWRSAFVAALSLCILSSGVRGVGVGTQGGVEHVLLDACAAGIFCGSRSVPSARGLGAAGKAKIFYGLGLLFFVCGLMSKAMVVTLPFILLLMDWWPLRRVQRRTIWRLIWEKLPFIAAAIVAGC